MTLSEFSPVPQSMQAARGPILFVPASVPLSSYEDEVLKSLRLPYFLPYKKKKSVKGLEFHFRAPEGWYQLVDVDSGPRQNQEVGIMRLAQLLHSMSEARSRMLSPGFQALRPEDLWLNPAGIAFPLLPLGDHADKAERKFADDADFWERWRAFYRVQTELGDLGRTLSLGAEWRKLEEVFRKLKRVDRHANTKVTRSPVYPAYQAASSQDTRPLPPPPEEYRVAELIELGSKEKATRKALLWEAEYIVGRDPAICDLWLEENWVGRLHARLERRGGHWLIKDFSSRNGTYVNGRRLRGEEVLLLPRQCELRFGHSRFKFAIR